MSLITFSVTTEVLSQIILNQAYIRWSIVLELHHSHINYSYFVYPVTHLKSVAMVFTTMFSNTIWYGTVMI
jgi:hypothetical protein